MRLATGIARRQPRLFNPGENQRFSRTLPTQFDSPSSSADQITTILEEIQAAMAKVNTSSEQTSVISAKQFQATQEINRDIENSENGEPAGDFGDPEELSSQLGLRSDAGKKKRLAAAFCPLPASSCMLRQVKDRKKLTRQEPGGRRFSSCKILFYA